MMQTIYTSCLALIKFNGAVRIRKMKKLYNGAWGITHDSLRGIQKDISAELTQ